MQAPAPAPAPGHSSVALAQFTETPPDSNPGARPDEEAPPRSRVQRVHVARAPPTYAAAASCHAAPHCACEQSRRTGSESISHWRWRHWGTGFLLICGSVGSLPLQIRRVRQRVGSLDAAPASQGGYWVRTPRPSVESLRTQRSFAFGGLICTSPGTLLVTNQVAGSPIGHSTRSWIGKRCCLRVFHFDSRGASYYRQARASPCLFFASLRRVFHFQRGTEPGKRFCPFIWLHSPCSRRAM